MAAPARTSLPTPSKDHATCAWCAAQFASIVQLLNHVDDDHLGAAGTRAA